MAHTMDRIAYIKQKLKDVSATAVISYFMIYDADDIREEKNPSQNSIANANQIIVMYRYIYRAYNGNPYVNSYDLLYFELNKYGQFVQSQGLHFFNGWVFTHRTYSNYGRQLSYFRLTHQINEMKKEIDVKLTKNYVDVLKELYKYSMIPVKFWDKT